MLGSIAAALTWHVASKRKRAISAAALFPFACVAFSGVWFVIYATINTTLLHRDPNLGDTLRTSRPLGMEHQAFKPISSAVSS